MKTKHLILLLALFLPTPAWACDHHALAYGTAATVDFCLYKTDGTAFKSDATFSAGDVKISKDEAAEANVGTLPTDRGQCYSMPFTNTELTAARVYVAVVHAGTWLDKCLIIETYGNASAQNPIPSVNLVQMDGTNTSSLTELSSVPGATPSLLGAIQFVYEVAKNKLTSTSTTQTLYKNDSSTTLGTATLSYDGGTGTLTRGKMN